MCALQRVIAGHTNNGAGAEPGACGANDSVVLAKVYPGSADGRSQFHIVINEKRYSVPLAQPSQFCRLPVAFDRRQLFLAVLDHRGPARDGLCDPRSEFCRRN